MASAVLPHPSLSGPDLGSVVLRDGEEFTFRFGTPDDRDALAEAFEQLSPRSRYMRFFSPMPSLSDTMLGYLSDVDRTDRVAVTAHPSDDPDSLVGVVRYYRNSDTPNEAEVALTVLDSHQGRGLGGAIYGRCVSVARANGIDTFTATVLGENRAMIKFFTKRGGEVVRDPGDASTVLVRIPL